METLRSSTVISSSNLLFLPILFSFLHFGSAANLLPQEEVETLKTTSERLENKHWPTIDRNSCNGVGDPKKITASLAGVICDCSFPDPVNINDTICHVTSIIMKMSNLTGILPSEIANLTYLQTIDFSLNYIGGSLPTTLNRLNLTVLSLFGNRISGSIPNEISEIVTLKELVLENNQLQGSLPPSLGNLRIIERLCLSANNLSGSIPKEFDKLTTLLDFRIDGNAISGRIPDFIGNWINLTRLDMQGTSLEGPFPSTISQLKNLRQLRITDLQGPTTMLFPNLEDLKNMEYLTLRNCFINGSIPPYIADMSGLRRLDLSFNQLMGSIPDRIGSLGLNYLLLADNSLSQEVPQWIVDKSKRNLDIDVSYNNLSNPPHSASFCQSNNVILVSSYSVEEDYRTPWCLKKGLPCSQNPKNYELYINCGGEALDFEGKTYEDDSTPTTGIMFNAVEEKWACSTAGVFMGKSNLSNIANTSSTNVTGVYTTARLAPTSLKYYALCLRKGSYKVRLHFAEIVITNDFTSNGLGRRIFDVSIQVNNHTFKLTLSRVNYSSGHWISTYQVSIWSLISKSY